jgi:tetratricopeptide (TPR) repeat protein
LGSAIEIVGAPGIGKTRLLQELTRLAPEFSTFRAFCEPHQQQIPYRPFRAIIRAALAIPKDAAPAAAYEHLRDAVETAAPSLLRWLPLLGIVADIDVPMTQEVADLGEEFRRRKLEETAVEFLTALFAKPTIVELEDVHWLDEPSTALLARIVDAAAQQPWVVAVTRRAEATGFVLAPGEHRHPLVLAPLQPGETEELIAAATHERPFRRHDVEALTTRSAGNPLFLSQLLKVALESGSVDSLPLTVESLVTAEIDRLSPADRRVLRVASVLGMAFPEDLLVSVLEAEEEYVDPRVWDRLGKFLYAEAPGRRRFRHALMRDAAYEGLPFGRRRGLHARAGVLVISDSEDPAEHAELLSFHFFAAQSYFDSWAYSKISGERALAKFANVDAAAFFSRALESGKRANIPPPQLAAVHEQLGDVRLTLNEFDAARAAYAAGRRLVPDDRIAQGRFLLQEAKTHYRGGRSADAIRSIRRGMRLLEDDHSPAGRKAFARLAALYAGTRVSQGRSREAERWCRRIIEESDGVGELEALARAYYILDLALMEHGRVEEVVHSTRSAELYEQLGDLSNQSEVISNSGGFAYLRGRWDEAFDLYGRALELRRRVGDDAEAAIVAANMAEIRLDQGRLDEAQALLAQAGKAIHAGGYLVAQGYLAGLLGRAAALAGRLTEALDDFSAALNIFERTTYRTHVFEMHMRIADALVLAGEPEAALEEADEALVIASELGGIPARLPSLHRIRASAFVALDQVEDARAALEQSLETARARLARHEIGLTLDALVKLDRLVGREPDPAIVEQSQAILAELDLVRVPELPALETTLATSR